MVLVWRQTIVLRPIGFKKYGIVEHSYLAKDYEINGC
jgi:hypothetical protein